MDTIIHTLSTGHRLVAKNVSVFGSITIITDLTAGDGLQQMDLMPAELDALTLWWLNKNPALLEKVALEQRRTKP